MQCASSSTGVDAHGGETGVGGQQQMWTEQQSRSLDQNTVPHHLGTNNVDNFLPRTGAKCAQMAVAAGSIAQPLCIPTPSNRAPHLPHFLGTAPFTPNPMGGQPTHLSPSGGFPQKANMYEYPEIPTGIPTQP